MIITFDNLIPYLDDKIRGLKKSAAYVLPDLVLEPEPMRLCAASANAWPSGQHGIYENVPGGILWVLTPYFPPW